MNTFASIEYRVLLDSIFFYRVIRFNQIPILLVSTSICINPYCCLHLFYVAFYFETKFSDKNTQQCYLPYKVPKRTDCFNICSRKPANLTFQCNSEHHIIQCIIRNVIQCYNFLIIIKIYLPKYWREFIAYLLIYVG